MPARRAAKDPSSDIGTSTERFVALVMRSAEIVERSGEELTERTRRPRVHHDRVHLLERRRTPHAWR